MSRLVIQGGRPLCGSVHISGSKNESLPILCASLLTKETVLSRVPDLADTKAVCCILRHCGCSVAKHGKLYIRPGRHCNGVIPQDLMNCMRSSVLFLAPLLLRCGKVVFSHPGGCRLGRRPIDLHLWVLRRMGVRFSRQGDRITGICRGMRGTDICLPYPSVGATETALMAAAGAKGKTVLKGWAKEPEIRSLMAFLQKAGCVITEEGDSVTVCPIKKKQKVTYTIGPDRIETVTWMCAAQAAGGILNLEDTSLGLVETEAELLRKMGASVYQTGGTVTVESGRAKYSVQAVTGPWPALSTDAGPLLAAAAFGSRRDFSLRETVFPGRFSHTEGFTAMGARCRVTGRELSVIPGSGPTAGTVTGYDLRGAAALVIAALAAGGETVIHGAEHLRRGYEKMEYKLRRLGVKVKENI